MQIRHLGTGLLILLIYNACIAQSTQVSKPIEEKASVPGIGTPWKMHSIDLIPASGSDGVKMADVNHDGFPDLVTGFEEEGVSRIYINPGQHLIKKQYWRYVELPSPDVEDALLVDLDGNGIVDLVTAAEGKSMEILFHWAPSKAEDYLDKSKWQTQIVPSTKGMSAWMFVVAIDMDHKNGRDLIVGGKRKAGETGDDKSMIGWLKCPENPRDTDKWTFHPLTKAGWTMSIVETDMNDDGRKDILLSDRINSSHKGVRWLENPGTDSPGFYHEWKSHMLGVEDGEPMFLALYDLNNDGRKDVVVPDLRKGLVFLEHPSEVTKPWKKYILPYPGWAGPRGKAVDIGDIDLDGKPDLILSFEEEGNVSSIPFETYKNNGRCSVIWGKWNGSPFSQKWHFQTVSGLRGRKFDLVTLIDMDGDGDLDALTNDENEEDRGLGIVWHENPTRK